jgi:hypothetical protein
LKKKRLIILLSILAAVLVVGCFAFLCYAAAAVKDSLINYYISDENIEQLSRMPEHIELGSDPEPGYTIHYQDYFLTLTGYDKAVINNDLTDNFRTIYIIDDDKAVLFQDMGSFKNDYIFNGPTTSSLIEKAAGKKINSEYDYLEATFFCTPEDYSLFDEDKNKGVCSLLIDKSSRIGDNCYQFDNGTVRGFINIITPKNAYVLFSNCDAPDSLYQIIFSNFSTDEVKEMLGTITFDGGGSN